MREILFRGLSEYENKWLYGYFCITKVSNACIGKSPFVITDCVILETVGQYTGLTDKNGVKIFEGDIVKIVNAVVSDDTFVVEWTDGKEFGNGYGLFNCFEYEIIGNIHDKEV